MSRILLLCFWALLVSNTAVAKELPSQFENNLIYLTPKLKDGRRLRIYTDTGGGFNAISKELSEEYGWELSEQEDDDGVIEMADMPQFSDSASVPLAGLNNALRGKLVVVPKDKLSTNGEDDGFFGGRWHAEKIIDFNYLTKTISNLDSLPSVRTFSKVSLGFQKDPDGNYTMAFPSMDIEVDGQVIPMLFDTGAKAWPSAEAKKLLRLTGDTVATSFMISSIFDKWVEDHPDWTVVKNACRYSKESMIKVPKIKIGERIVGSVWFTRREDHNLHDYMSPMMDRRIDGALGGSALQHVRVIVDYPNEAAYIENDMSPTNK